jgi:hypothetical protein
MKGGGTSSFLKRSSGEEKAYPCNPLTVSSLPLFANRDMTMVAAHAPSGLRTHCELRRYGHC